MIYLNLYRFYANKLYQSQFFLSCSSFLHPLSLFFVTVLYSPFISSIFFTSFFFFFFYHVHKHTFAYTYTIEKNAVLITYKVLRKRSKQQPTRIDLEAKSQNKSREILRGQEMRDRAVINILVKFSLVALITRHHIIVLQFLFL